MLSFVAAVLHCSSSRHMGQREGTDQNSQENQTLLRETFIFAHYIELLALILQVNIACYHEVAEIK